MESIQGFESGKPFLSGSLTKIGASPAKPELDEQNPQGLGNILSSFGGLLKNQMANINNLQTEANQAQQTYATGGDIELHNVIMATEKADLALQLAMQIRNKAVAAYQEVSHMAI